MTHQPLSFNQTALQPLVRGSERLTLITGGAGFVGSNLADALLSQGRRVRVLDNLARAGVSSNLQWLKNRYGSRIEFVRGDVRDPQAVRAAVRDAETVFHFAAQVAVTSSLARPVEDFEVNLAGTLNVLEAARASARKPPVLFTSTNKVYGSGDQVKLRSRQQRYEPADPHLAEAGFDERTPLSFHSPYGCSKGAADQYVLDYARTYQLRAAVFRMSCIYGPRQFGTEDQGWVAHFLIQALRNERITLFGDGRQVRDILFVSDLVQALLAARDSIDEISGEAFNIGGGPENAVSLREILDKIADLVGRRPSIEFQDWRLGDQRYYVSHIGKARERLAWSPRVSVSDGLRRLYEWMVTEGPAAAAPVAAVAGGTRS